MLGDWYPVNTVPSVASLRLTEKLGDVRNYVCVRRLGEGRKILKFSINGCMILKQVTEHVNSKLVHDDLLCTEVPPNRLDHIFYRP